MFENAPDGIVILDPATSQPLEFNDTACRQLGYSREEFARLKLLDIEAAESPAAIRRHIATVLRIGRDDFETLQRTRQGEIRNVQVTAQLTEHAGKTVYHCIWRDITDRKRAEEALRRAHEHLRGFVDANIVGVVVASASGGIIEANDYYLRLIGYTREEFEQGRVNWRAITPPEWLPADERSIKELGERGVSAPYEKEYVRRDGTRVSVFLADALLPGPEKHIAAFVLDITDRKRAEKELCRSEAFIKAVMDNLPLGIAVNSADPGVDFQYMNDNFPLFYRTSREALAEPDAFWSAVYEEPEFRAEIKKRVLDAATGGDPSRMHWDDVPLTRRGEKTTYISARDIPLPGERLMISTVWDVTERKLAEEALRQAHERLAKVFASVPEALVVSRRADGTILDVNDNWPVLTGYSREETVGKRSLDLNLFADPADRERAIALASGPRSLRGYELRIRRKSGELREAVMSADFLEVGGEPLLLSVIQDVTERRRAERARRESEEKLRLFIEHAPAALAMFDREMRYLAVSRRWMSDYGLGERDIIGRSHYEIFPEVTEELKEIHSRGLAGEVMRSGADRFERVDGSAQYLRWEMRPWVDGVGGIGGIVIFSEDITDRTLAELALKESEARFRSLIELAPEAIFVQSEGRFLYLNAAMVGLFGASKPEDLLGSEVMPRIAPEYREAVHRRIRAQRETLSPAPLMDQEYLRLDGTRVPVETTAVPIRFEDREAHLVFVRDITERKRAEAAVRSSLKEKETLLREIHHRVKNNMQVISSLFSLQAGHIEDEGALRILREGQTRIRSMALIHEKLYQSPDLSKIDFASYIRTLAAYLFQFFRLDAHQVRLETDLEEVDLDLNSAVPCGLLINELVSNALKHAFPGGRQGVVRLRLRRGEEGRVELRIEDDGVGIPKGLDHRHVSSFGLQIVNLLAGQLEGTLTLDREKGTSFTLSFRELNYQKRL